MGDHEREAVARLMSERPDVILLSGDLHQGSPGQLRAELPELRRLLARLDAPGGVFAVQGNVESVAEVRRHTRAARVQVLENSSPACGRPTVSWP